MAQIDEARKKALQSPRIGKRGPGKLTIAKREALKIFEEELAPHLDKVIKLHINEALNPDNRQERKDLLERKLGKVEEVKKSMNLNMNVDISPERQKLVDEYEDKLKELESK